MFNVQYSMGLYGVYKTCWTARGKCNTVSYRINSCLPTIHAKIQNLTNNRIHNPPSSLFKQQPLILPTQPPPFLPSDLQLEIEQCHGSVMHGSLRFIL